MNKANAVFLTGVTGTLGKELLKALVSAGDGKIYLLVRPKKRQTQGDRIRKILADCGQENLLGTRVHVFDGDVTLPGFGLDAKAVEILRREVGIFYHVAALTALNGSEEDCRRINLGGTLEALNLAWDLRKNGRLERFFYFSTAYVAGSLQTYRSMEDRLPDHPKHANFYESSKYESEKKVREAIAQGLPGTIFRPSIVVGDSRTGAVSEFNVIYPFMKLYAHGILSKLPTRPDNSFNIVPIDFVVNASLAISGQADSVGKTYHLVTEKPPTIGMLLKLGAEEYPNIPRVQVVSPDEFKSDTLSPEEKIAYGMLRPYLGYLNDHLTFDMANTHRALKGTGIGFPVTDYAFLKRLVEYAVGVGYLIPG